MCRKLVQLTFIFCVGASINDPAPSSGLDPFVVLQPSDAEPWYGNDFGAGLAMNSDWLIIGSPGDYELEVDSGAAYVFRRVGATWVEHQKLFGVGGWNERFGWVVSLDDDWLVINSGEAGDITDCCGTGRLLIFQRNLNGTKSILADDHWDLFQIINQDLSLCCLGGAVIDDGVMVAGAGPEHNPDTDTGRAYVFEWDGTQWAGPQTIHASDPSAHSNFGASVSISGSRLAVGAPNAGAVYIFRRDRAGWIEEKKLTAAGQYFGASVRLSGSVLVVGAPSENAAYVFKREGDNWIQRCRLLPWERGPGQFPDFGNSMAVKDDLIVAAARDQPWAYSYRLVDGTCVPLEALYATQGVETTLRVVTDGRIVAVRNHLYAVGNFDLKDFSELQNCLGPDRLGGPSQCSSVDMNTDGVVDALDLPLFLLTFRGPS